MLAPCGTPAAYRRHLRAGQPPCDPCRKAATAYRNRFDKQRPERAFLMREKLLDWLFVDGGWLTAEGMAADLAHNTDSVERVLRRLRDEGYVESRIVELAHTSRGSSYDSRTEWRVL